LQRRIASGRGVTVVHALTGARGVGKSVEAAEWARTSLAKGARVAWVDAETREQIVAAFAEAAGQLGLDTDPQEPEAAAARAVRALSDGRDRVLVVFDNVVDPAPVREFLPHGPRVRVVVTTTERSAAALGDAIDIDRFSRAEARRFLAERTGLSLGDAADELIDELDALPLALSHAAARIAETGQDFAAYLTDLRAFPIERVLPHAAWDQYPRSVAAAVMLSVDKVAADDPEKVWPLLARLVLLSPAGAPADLLHDGSDAGRFDAVAICGRLRTASLVSLSAGNSMVVMHGLTRRVVAEAAGSEALAAVVLPLIHRIIDGVERTDVRGGEHAADLEQARTLRDVIPRDIDGTLDKVLDGLDAIGVRHHAQRQEILELAADVAEAEEMLDRAERIADDDPRLPEARARLEKIRRRVGEL
ncbi:MAG TPA: hypothetical protein VGF17_11640, partial [Phytomonospora sp.]